jgi:hypothetical protein
MGRRHIRHLHSERAERPLVLRLAITVGAPVALPVFSTIVGRVGAVLDHGIVVLLLLALAHVPAVIVLVALWSIGCDVCR